MSPATRTRLLGVCALLCLILVATCQKNGHVVDKNVDYAVWSRDGQSVYCTNNTGQLQRYDTSTGSRQSFRVPDIVLFDMSPDEHKAVYLRYEHMGVYVADLQTGKTELVHAAKTDIYSVHWISKDTVAFCEQNAPHKEGVNTYMLDLQSKSVTRFHSGTAIRFRAVDGSGFVYEDAQYRFYYYNLRHKTDVPLKPCPPSASEWTVELIYLDAKRAVYHKWSTTNPDCTEVLDLATMRTRTVALPQRIQNMAISPDLQRYWWRGTGVEPGVLTLCLVDIPPATVKQLKAPVK